MAKLALLIGVGSYRQASEFTNLAAVAADVAAMEQVLLQPAVGGFAPADVKTLLHPEPQEMREAMERLFAQRQPDDLLVLYFSGHGVVDDGGRFHFTTAQTVKDLLNSTAISAGFVHRLMEGSRSKRQVVMLDCCFSGAFARGMTAKGAAVNLQTQLGGRGRAVLTSSSATEYSFEQKEAALSVYTRFVVEGLRTGIADLNGDGWISVDELHDFAGAKVREVTPAMQPKIYAVEEGYKIQLAQAPMGDPKLEYRQEVERLAKQRQGQFSMPILMALEEKQQQLGLAPDVAMTIQQEVLRPYEEFAAKLQKYQQALQSELQPDNQLSQASWEDLQYLQRTLGLTDHNIQPWIKQVKILSTSNAQASNSQPQAEPAAAPSNPLPQSGSDRPQPQSRPAHRLVTKQSWIMGGAIVSLLALVGVGVFQQLGSESPSDPQPLATPSPANDSTPSTADNSAPSTAEEFFERGLEKQDKEDYQGAIADYGQAIQLKPDYAVAYYNRGVTRRKLGDHKGAIADYNQAIKIKPDYALAYNNRGIARSDLGDYKGAIADYDQAIKLKPDYALAYNNRGIARSDLGDHKGAIADYDQAIQLRPDYALAYYNRGVARRKLGDHKGGDR